MDRVAVAATDRDRSRTEQTSSYRVSEVLMLDIFKIIRDCLRNLAIIHYRKKYLPLYKNIQYFIQNCTSTVSINKIWAASYNKCSLQIYYCKMKQFITRYIDWKSKINFLIERILYTFLESFVWGGEWFLT